jgi:hypothetical protein
MENEKIFLDFIKLAYMYFREEKNIEFYAKGLDITQQMLKKVIEESSDKNFEKWLELFENSN